MRKKHHIFFIANISLLLIAIILGLVFQGSISDCGISHLSNIKDVEDSHIVLNYAWNENDEGGLTLTSFGSDVDLYGVASALIIATGASWRKLNVPGETDYIGRGVAFCPHCDGPFYKGKHVAVVGGGNSGIEAAIDLAGICSKVTVFEFMDELKADLVLQEKAKSLPNVEIFVGSQTTEVIGNGDKLTSLRIKDRKTDEERIMELDGVFVQIGLAANSAAFRGVVEMNRFGEIGIDSHCRTNVPGIYAAGDVSTVPYKQIIIAMGEGAKAALSAFEDKVRGII